VLLLLLLLLLMMMMMMMMVVVIRQQRSLLPDKQVRGRTKKTFRRNGTKKWLCIQFCFHHY
jgi:preprotein translocase subunit YajC